MGSISNGKIAARLNAWEIGTFRFTSGSSNACSNGLDDDGDGLVDYPADPGCANAADRSERNAAVACDDGVDNDGDGLIDFPADPSCTSPADTSEGPGSCGLVGI